MKEKIMRKICEVNGTEVYFIETEVFKTETISVYFQDELKSETLALNSLLPNVLRHGSKNYPSMKALSSKLDSMYGAMLYCDVMKKGMSQIAYFSIDCVDDKFTNANSDAGSSTFTEACELLFDVIANPLTEDVDGVESFSADYVRQEKANTISLIEGRINDKAQYATERCIEEMWKPSVLGEYELGSVEEVERMTAGSLYERYTEFLNTAKRFVFITGRTVDEKIDIVKNILENTLPKQNVPISPLQIVCTLENKNEAKNISEEMKSEQGKLCLSYNTHVATDTKEYFALLMFNAIFGGSGFFNSKLFLNVREKEGLCYHVASDIDKFSGVMLVGCGIDAKEKDRTMRVIFEQLEEMQKGNISDFEMSYTKDTIEYSLKCINDSQMMMTEYKFSQLLKGNVYDFDEYMENINVVTKEEVVAVANKVTLDTIYFLG
jgi:predicted Zn-dependent peptidase